MEITMNNHDAVRVLLTIHLFNSETFIVFRVVFGVRGS